MSEDVVRTATPEDAEVVGRLLWDFNTEFETSALKLCREREAGERHIAVDEVDTDSRRLYERHGFLNVLPGTDYRMLFYEREL